MQLRNLQGLAGLPLIQRTGDGMVLTDAGREVLALSERIEAAMAACATSLDMMAGKTGGRISIGAVSTAKYFVPFAISAFAKLHPKIEILLTVGNREETIAGLRNYDLDIAIMGRPPAEDRHGCEPDRRSSACDHRAEATIASRARRASP